MIIVSKGMLAMIGFATNQKNKSKSSNTNKQGMIKPKNPLIQTSVVGEKNKG